MPTSPKLRKFVDYEIERSGALIERVLPKHEVLAHLRASKSPKPGSRLLLEGRWEAEMVERQNELFRLRFGAVMETRAGKITAGSP